VASFSLAGHPGLGESPHRYGPDMAAATEASSPPLSARAARWEPKCLTIARTAPDQIRVLWGVGRGPTDAPIKVDPQTAQIFKLPTMINPGVYPKPIPFGGMGKPVNQNGFSDHFPITIRGTEVDRPAWTVDDLRKRAKELDLSGYPASTNPNWCPC
jgi:hypothetical protein